MKILTIAVWLTFCLPHEWTGATSNDTNDGDVSLGENGNRDVDDVIDDDSKKDIFTPTRDWKVIEEGQIIPAGLHVRVDLQTGVKEAKLMDESSDDSAAEMVPTSTKNGDAPFSLTPSSSSSSSSSTPSSSHHRAFDDSLKTLDDDVDPSSSSASFVRANFRSIETLKEELADVFDGGGVKVETDADIMKKLLRKYDETFGRRRPDLTATTIPGKKALEERIAISSNLEYYLHQYDNAIDFDAMGGFETLIRNFATYGSLVGFGAESDDEEVVRLRGGTITTTTTTTIRWMSAVAHCLGSAMSSNPKMQIAAAKKRLLTHLLSSILASGKNMNYDDNDDDDGVRRRRSILTLATRSFYALAALTRNFPHAQAEFAAQDGVRITVEWLESVVSRLEGGGGGGRGTRSDDKSLLKLAIRLAGFLSDLFDERRDFISRMESTDADSSSNDEDVEKRRQYLRVDLETLLVDAGCCRQIERLTAYVASALSSSSSSVTSSSSSSASVKPTVDDVDKTVSAAEAFFKVSACELRHNRGMNDSLRTLRKSLRPMIVDEELEEGSDGDRTLRDLADRIGAVVAEFTVLAKSEL